MPRSWSSIDIEEKRRRKALCAEQRKQRKMDLDDLVRRLRVGTSVTVGMTLCNTAEMTAIANAVQGNPSLKTLDFRGVPLGLGSSQSVPRMEALVAGLRGSSVMHLGLSDTQLGDFARGTESFYLEQCHKALAAVLKKTRITSLDLSHNSWCEKGMHQIAAGLKRSSVTSLDLQYCGLLPIGELADVLPECSISTLNLRCCKLWDQALDHLARVLQRSSLTSLDLSDNDFNFRTSRKFLEALKDSSVTHLVCETTRVGSWKVDPKFKAEMFATVEANKSRSFVLQLEVQESSESLRLTFRTMGGTVAAILDWNLERPVQELADDVLAAMRTSNIQPPFKGLCADNLRIVGPGALLLELGASAAPLAQQLKSPKRPLDEAGSAATGSEDSRSSKGPPVKRSKAT